MKRDERMIEARRVKAAECLTELAVLARYDREVDAELWTARTALNRAADRAKEIAGGVEDAVPAK